MNVVFPCLRIEDIRPDMSSTGEPDPSSIYLFVYLLMKLAIVIVGLTG